MKALVLGARGQLGQALVAAAPPDADIVALDRAACDICVKEQVVRAIDLARPDFVFNVAAFTAVDRAESEAAAASALNAHAPGIVAAAARAAGARTVHVSTDYVFDGTLDRPYRPDDLPNPQSAYGRSKLAGEAAVQSGDPDALTIRTMWLYSSRGTNFVTRMLRLMREEDQLRVVSDQIGSPTRAASLAAALWALAGAGATGLWHYRDAGTASWHEFAVAIQEQAHALGLLERHVPIEPIASAEFPVAAARPHYSVLDATDAWRQLGEPAHWRDNLARTLEEIRAHG